jgi:hypothetical protein
LASSLVVEYNGSGKAINYFTSSTLASAAVALPVAWLSFDGKLINPAQIDLHWSTASENNNAAFEVERMNEHGEFMRIGSMAGHGNLQQICHYYFADQQLQNIPLQTNVITYRLKQIDFDGKFSYSKEININVEQLVDMGISVINPISSQIEIKSVYNNVPTQIIISNLNGKIIYETQTNLQAQTIIPLSSELPAGMYFLHIVQRTGKQTFKLIKG